MYRKVLIATLLCLGLSQTANAQYTNLADFIDNIVNQSSGVIRQSTRIGAVFEYTKSSDTTGIVD